MSVRSLQLAVLIVTLASGTALAHIPSIEPQATYHKPKKAPASADYSFESPRVLESVTDSQAVFAYLTAGDVDVYKFTVTAADLATGPVIVAASALPPACHYYRNAYPVTALMGPRAPSPFGPPGLPAPQPGMDLPFEVPAGMGVIKAENPAAGHKEKREIFHVEEEDLGAIAWFLPEGLSQECLTENQSACDFSNTIAQPVFYPGDYYLVIWDPAGDAMDYTANIGFSEENYSADPDVLDQIRDNALLHHPCKEPYPWCH
jgi:hypothetical protein